MALSADPKTIKALALDLDGTILGPGGVLSARMTETVNKCIQLGLRIIINTGRSMEGTEPYRTSLGVRGPVIYCNGAVVADMPSGRILSSMLMDKKAMDFCFELSRKTGIFCQVYFLVLKKPDTKTAFSSEASGDARMILVTDQDCAGRQIYYEQTGIIAELMDLDKALAAFGQEGCIKTMFIGEPSSLSAIRPKLEEAFGNSVYMTRTRSNFLELMDAKVSKGNGLKFVMERLSLKKEEVIAFGDDENDAPMADAAGFFIAPDNAKDIVKAHADLITAPNTEDGVAAFLEKFFCL